MEIGTFRHYLDGNLIEEPQGYREFTEKVERDYQQRLIGVKYPVDVTFTGDGYDVLRTAYADDPCAVLTYTAQMWDGDIWQNACNGVVIMSDVEWNLSRGSAAVSITDDGIGARILNNRKLRVPPEAQNSKLGDALATTATPFSLYLFNPGDALATYLADDRKAFDWLDLISHVVRYITNESVSVVSDWYDALPDDERWAVTDMVEVNNANFTVTDLAPDFETLFGDMAKLYNLMGAIERDTNGNPVFRIEPEDYFYGGDSLVAFPNTDNLIRKTELRRLYATVNLGSKDHFKVLTPTSTRHLPYLRLRGFVIEQVSLRAECNTDSELDLSTDYITDSNAIEAAIAGNSDMDGKFCFIQYDRTTGKATKGDYLYDGTNPYLYNEAALNINVLNRQSLPFDAIVEVGDPADGFIANANYGVSGTLTYTGTGLSGPYVAGGTPYRFNDDYTAPGEDPNNNYGNGTAQGSPISAANSRFTAPIQGFYSFTAEIPWEIVQNTYQDFAIGCRVAYIHRDSGGTVLGTGYGGGIGQQAVGYYGETLSFSINMAVGDYVTIHAGFQYVYLPLAVPNGPPPHTFTARFRNLAQFRTDYVEQGGGIVRSVDPDAFYATVYEFDRYVTLAEWVSLREDTSLAVRVGPDASTVKGYVMTAERNALTGSCKWSLIANRLPE